MPTAMNPANPYIDNDEDPANGQKDATRWWPDGVKNSLKIGSAG